MLVISSTEVTIDIFDDVLEIVEAIVEVGKVLLLEELDIRVEEEEEIRLINVVLLDEEDSMVGDEAETAEKVEEVVKKVKVEVVEELDVKV